MARIVAGGICFTIGVEQTAQTGGELGLHRKSWSMGQIISSFVAGCFDLPA